MKSTIGKILLIFALYVAVFFFFERLQFALDKDEKHFWPTSLLFSQSYLPSTELLKSYNELNTPLPFYIFGVIEKLTNAGPFGGRLLNLGLSFLIIIIIVSQDAGGKLKALFYGLAAFAFPYFLGTSVFLYTDILCAFFVLIGYLFYKREQLALSMLGFILAIACRQYALAFPAGLILYNLANRQKNPKLYVSMIIASISILPWFILWKGFAPPVATQAQNLATASIWRLFPEHSLYFLSCLGLYFVIPEHIIKNGFKIPNQRPSWQLIVIALAALGIAFIAFPPLGNVNYGIPTMGYFDKVCRMFLSDVPRVGVFYIFAGIALIRFIHNTPENFLVWVNAALMAKAHIGWDKYILPLLVCLWLYNAMTARPNPTLENHKIV